MKYWVISPNVLHDNTEKKWKTRICDEKKVFIGWQDDNKFGSVFANKICIYLIMHKHKFKYFNYQEVVL